jgi:hypothetical protein
MKTNSLFWALSWVAVGSFAAMQGCGGDDDDGGDGSSGGKGGSAGSATGGKGGSAGSATGGKGGSAGSATGGKGGTAGAPGGAGGEGGNSVGGEGGGSGESRAEVCADYCQLYFDTGCSAFDGGFYGTVAGCQTLCETSVWELGEPGAAAGNSVHCRLTHAGLAAAATDPMTHCGHARADSTGICVP